MASRGAARSAGSVVAHIDADAFYAQVEARRLGLNNDPGDGVALAVQQWDGLIAVSYPARAKGVTRFMRPQQAKAACPDITLVHVETIGDDDNDRAGSGAAAGPSPRREGSKVSLERYRAASREVLAAMKARLGSGSEAVVQRASIDEAYLDLTEVSRKIVESFGKQGAASEGAALRLPTCDPETNVPCATLADAVAAAWREAKTAVIGWQGTGAVPDAAVPYVVAAWVMHQLRKHVRAETGYTMTAGLASNKMIAKLASARNKPNKQTLVLPNASAEMVAEVPLAEINGFKGKAGASILAALDPASTPREIVEAFDDAGGDLESGLQRVLSREQASWVAAVCRGEREDDPVVANSLVKSISACKSGHFKSPAETRRWIEVLGNEVASRLADETARRGRTAARARQLVVHYRGNLNADHKAQWMAGNLSALTRERSRSGPLPSTPYPPSGESLIAAAWRLFTKNGTGRPEDALADPCTRIALTIPLPDEDGTAQNTRDIAEMFSAARTAQAPEAERTAPGTAAAAPAAPVVAAVPTRQPSAWSCCACTLENLAGAARCDACGTLRGGALPPASVLSRQKQAKRPLGALLLGSGGGKRRGR